MRKKMVRHNLSAEICAHELIPILGDPLLKNAMLKNFNDHQNFLIVFFTLISLKYT
jgi:hypothetical protein